MSMEIFTPEQVAERLRLRGKDPVRAVVRMCAAGQLPGARKVGRTWRVPDTALPIVEALEDVVRRLSGPTSSIEDPRLAIVAMETTLGRGDRQRYVMTASWPTRVYFVLSEVGRIKIGVAEDPESRLRTLQVGSPVELWLAAHIPGDDWVERALHEVFKTSCVRGEWFEPCDALVSLVERLRAVGAR